MLNLDEINQSIQELEEGATNFVNCSKLASLYIVKYYFKNADNTNDDVITEYSDILPEYTNYCKIKTEYQMQNTTKDKVLNAMSDVCREISEFITTLYNSSDMQEERNYITDMIDNLKSIEH